MVFQLRLRRQQLLLCLSMVSDLLLESICPLLVSLLFLADDVLERRNLIAHLFLGQIQLPLKSLLLDVHRLQVPLQLDNLPIHLLKLLLALHN